MRIADIKKACLATGMLYGIDAGRNGMYISNGRAAWPLPDGIECSERTMLELLDYSDKQTDETDVRSMRARDDDMFDYAGPIAGETRLRFICHIPAMDAAGELLLLETLDGDTYAIHEMDVKAGRVKGIMMEYALRGISDGGEGETMVACYNGMQWAALVKPVTNLGGVFAYLEELASRKVGYIRDFSILVNPKKNAQEDAEVAGEQMGMDLGGE